MPPKSKLLTQWVSDKFCNMCKINIPVAEFLATEHAAESTVPFLARYRQDATRGMSEHQVKEAFETYEELVSVETKRARMMAILSKNGTQVDEAFLDRLRNATSVSLLEEIWEPYKPVKEGKVAQATAKGYDSVSDLLLNTTEVIPNMSSTFRDKGEQDLLLAVMTHTLNQFSEGREMVKQAMWDRGDLHSELKAKPRKSSKLNDMDPREWEKLRSNFKTYDNWQKGVRAVKGYQTLALLRGEDKGALKLTFKEPSSVINQFNYQVRGRFSGLGNRLNKGSSTLEREILTKALEQSYISGALRAAELVARRNLKTVAHQEAMASFSSNIRDLVLQRPLKGAMLVSIDPGFKSGCKCVVLDDQGAILKSFMLSNPGQRGADIRWESALLPVINEFSVKFIVIGNGTGSRESEKIVAPIIHNWNDKVDRGEASKEAVRMSYSIVPETGASVYSACEAANEELGHLDILFRGAVSIGRRLQNPLSEMVKIPPEAIGVGMYQHDLDAKKLVKNLSSSVGSAVASVGIEINNASKYVLRTLPGLTDATASAIATRPDKWKSRQQLLDTSTLTAKAYKSVAGFLRVPESSEPLDNTKIHPESYKLAREILKTLGLTVASRSGTLTKAVRLYGSEEKAFVEVSKKVSGALGPQEVALVMQELAHPAPDPREELPHSGIFREEMESIDKLKEGQSVQGVITNVTNFGIFVDIGLHKAAMVPQPTDRDRAYCTLGKVVQCTVKDIQLAMERVALTLEVPSDFTLPIVEVVGASSAPPSPGSGSKSPLLKGLGQGIKLKAPVRAQEEPNATSTPRSSRFGKSSGALARQIMKAQEEKESTAEDGEDNQFDAVPQKETTLAQDPEQAALVKRAQQEMEAEERRAVTDAKAKTTQTAAAASSPPQSIERAIPRGEVVTATVLQEKDGQAILAFASHGREGRATIHERQYKDIAGSSRTFQKLEWPTRGTTIRVKVKSWVKTTEMGNALYSVEVDRAYYTTAPGAALLKKLGQAVPTVSHVASHRSRDARSAIPKAAPTSAPKPEDAQPTPKKKSAPATAVQSARGKRNRDDTIEL